MRCACDYNDAGPMKLCAAHDNQQRSAIAAEREACARIASGMSDGADCDERGAMDGETGEIPCGAESRGDVCVCAERSELAFKIADKIRARSNIT